MARSIRSLLLGAKHRLGRLRSHAGAGIKDRNAGPAVLPEPAPPVASPEPVPLEQLPVKKQLLSLGVDFNAIKTFRLEEFPVEGPLMWLDRPDAEIAIEGAVASGTITPEQGRHAKELSIDGFTVYEGFFGAEQLDVAWAAFEQAIASGKVPIDKEPEVPDPNWGRVPNVHAFVPEFDAILHDARLRAELSALLGREIIPLQTISSFRGSEQPAHSDAIHMTTWPLGFLTAAWIAFEDIHPDSGPLVYYPGSHRLPYRLSKAHGIEPGEFERDGRDVYVNKYEPAVQQLLEEKAMEPRWFESRKGDLLIWHHNLIHGGSPMADRYQSRKALVCHYYARNTICYHDLSGQIDVDR